MHPRVPKISGNQSWVAIKPWYTRGREGVRRIVPCGGEVAGCGSCQRRYMTASECPHVEGTQLVERISVMVVAPERKSPEEKCQAWPGRRETAVSVGRVRVCNAPWSAWGPLISRQDQQVRTRSH